METGRQRQPERCALLKMPSTKQPNCQTSIIRHTPSGEQTRRPKPTEVPDNAIACTGTSDNLDTNHRPKRSYVLVRTDRITLTLRDTNPVSRAKVLKLLQSQTAQK